MALINCPECQKKISDSSKKCIGCGISLNTDSNKMKKFWLIPFLILAVTFIYYTVFYEEEVVLKETTIDSSLDEQVVLTETTNASINSELVSDTNFFWGKLNEIKEIKNGAAYDINDNILGSFSSAGERQGKWTAYYKDNTLAYEGIFDKGLMNGFFKHYYENGILKHEGKYIDGGHQDVNKKSGIPQSGRDGKHIFYYNNGKISASNNFKRGEANGIGESWYKNGVKKNRIKYLYNCMRGACQEWDKTGKSIRNETLYSNHEAILD